MRRSARQAAPVVPDPAVRKMLIHIARVCFPPFPHKFQQELRTFPARGRPRTRSFGWLMDHRAGMHQRLKRLCHKSIHDKKVFLDLELRIQSFGVSGVIVFYAMTMYECLSVRGRTDWISLD